MRHPEDDWNICTSAGGKDSLSEKDLARMPESFPVELARIADERGGKLTVSQETRSMEGGFVLLYNGIEENCSFRAIFDAKRDELQDRYTRYYFFKQRNSAKRRM